MLANAPQVAVVNDNTHRKIKTAKAICTLFKQYYNETITTDEMAEKIAGQLKMNAGTVKTLLSQYRREGWQGPRCARKPRTSSIEIKLSFEELNAQWGK